MEIRSAYSPRLSVGLDCSDEPSRTKQAMKDECDINRIMKKFEKSGLVSHLQANPGFYDDVSNVPDYQTAFSIVREAQDVFSSLPAKLRSKFDNDPGKYLVFVSDPANVDEMRELGLLNPVPVAPEPVRVEVVNNPPVPSA